MEANNKLIAEFMGFEFTETPTCGILGGNKFTRLPKKDNKPPFEVHYGWNPPNYHKSWDWLIPCIDKIYSLDVYSVYVNTTSGQFENSININTRFIENTYEEVIEFIKWYNNEKS